MSCAQSIYSRVYVYNQNFRNILPPLTHQIHNILGHFHAKRTKPAAQTIKVGMHDQFGPGFFEEFNKTGDVLEIPTRV